MEAFSVVSHGPPDTARLASVVAGQVRAGDVILLTGDLAAGKTAFVKALAAAVDSPDVVTSPTFTLAQFYQSTAVQLLHIDTYRLGSIEEYRDLGLADYQDDCVTLIEWGDKVADDFPDHLSVHLERSAGDDAPDQRSITFTSSSARWVSIMSELEAEYSRATL